MNTGKEDEDPRAEVVEVTSGRRLTGDEAPLASQLEAWLETHPGWEAVPKQETSAEAGRQDDDDDEEYETGEEGDTDGSDSEEEDAEEVKKKPAEPAERRSIGSDETKSVDERVKDVISKAKVEDDEYKTPDTGEMNYYA